MAQDRTLASRVEALLYAWGVAKSGEVAKDVMRLVNEMRPEVDPAEQFKPKAFTMKGAEKEQDFPIPAASPDSFIKMGQGKGCDVKERTTGKFCNTCEKYWNYKDPAPNCTGPKPTQHIAADIAWLEKELNQLLFAAHGMGLEKEFNELLFAAYAMGRGIKVGNELLQGSGR